MKATDPIIYLILLLFLIVPAFGQVDLQNGLISCYSFSGNANDGSGNHNDGVLSGPVLTSDRFGKPNSAYLFRGSDRITIPSAPLINNQELSISTWASVTTLPSYGEAQMVLTIGDKNSYFFYGQTLTNHYSSVDFSGWGIGGSNQNLVSVAYWTDVLPQANTWYHLVLTINLDYVTLYINGVKAGQTYTGGVPLYFYQKSSCVAYIGMRSNGIQGFNGIIDDISIYNRVITTDEITKLYQVGLPCIPVEVNPPIVKDISICENNKASLLASGGTQYRWYDANNGGNLLFEGNPFVTPLLTNTTDYYVTTVENNIESKRVKVKVLINPIPTITCNFDSIGMAFQPVALNTKTTSGTTPFSYLFDFGDGTTLTSATSDLTHTYNKDGQFLVNVTVFDANGCVSNCSDVVDVRYKIFIPNVITVNNDTLNEVFTLFMVHDEKHYKYNGPKPFTMIIFNRWGEEVFRSENADHGWTGDHNSFGTYFYQIQLGENRFKGTVSLIR